MNVRMRKCVEALALRWSRTTERGATALVIALCMLLVMAAAAASFDTANLALQRQKLQNLTDAAAQAGAVYLRDNPKDLAGAKQAAFAYAYSYDKQFTLNDVSLWCMVGSTGATKSIAPGNIPTVCDPITYTGQVCDQNLCAIPCTATGASCNAIQISKNETVPFYFAPAIGINNGNTGAVASISCAKACGSGGTPNPLDVAIIADRTPSMTDTDFNAMKSGIEASLQTMTPEYQLATIGTIHRSNAAATDACKTSLGPAVTTNTTTTGSGRNQVTTTWYKDGGARDGEWLPLAQGNQTTGFSNSYLTGSLGSTGRTLKLTTDLGYQVDCMDHYYKTNSSGYPWGTHLAAPLKAAARLLLGKDPSNLATLSTQRASLLKGGATVKQWIIFETDGYPEETMGLNSTSYNPAYKDSTSASNDVSLDSSVEPSAPGDAGQGCKNLKDVATNAKAKGIGIIMIAYGNATTSQCGNQGTVASVMANAASPVNNTASLADKSCTSTGGQPAPENADGDYFFCASNASDLASIFKTAIGMTSSPNTKYVQMPK